MGWTSGDQWIGSGISLGLITIGSYLTHSNSLTLALTNKNNSHLTDAQTARRRRSRRNNAQRRLARGMRMRGACALPRCCASARGAWRVGAARVALLPRAVAPRRAAFAACHYAIHRAFSAARARAWPCCCLRRARRCHTRGRARACMARARRALPPPTYRAVPALVVTACAWRGGDGVQQRVRCCARSAAAFRALAGIACRRA